MLFLKFVTKLEVEVLIPLGNATREAAESGFDEAEFLEEAKKEAIAKMRDEARLISFEGSTSFVEV